MFGFSQREESSFASANLSHNAKEAVRKVRLPILILDPLWIELFPKNHKTARSLELEKKLVSLLKDEAAATEEQKLLTSEKKRHMLSIQELTVDVYVKKEQQAIEAMERSKAKILEINYKLKEYERKLIEIEDKIGEVNLDLLEETVSICYGLMTTAKAATEKLTPQVESLRKELFKVLSERMENEEIYDNSYNLLYRLVGREIITLLDKEAEEKRG